MRNKKRERISVLLLILLGISIGFAALATTLKINGTTIITKNTWNVYWDNIDNEDGVTPTSITIDDEDENNEDNIVNFSITFDKPGDYFEFTVDAVNAGTIDAEVLTIEKKYNGTTIPAVEDPNNRVVPAYLKYEVTYADGSAINVGDKLLKASGNTPTTRTVKVRVEYDRNTVTNEDINDQDGNVTCTFSLEVQYGQTTPGDDASIKECPGPDCLYAFFVHGTNYSADTYLYAGDILPLEIATLGPGATSEYNAGPTSDYRNLKLDYNAYRKVDSSTGEYEYGYVYNSFEECDEDLPYNTCPLYKHVSYNPSIFLGFILDDERVIQKKYMCIKSSNQAFCVMTEDLTLDYDNFDYETYEQEKRSKALTFFGEYDSITGVGCRTESDPYYGQDEWCTNSDKTAKINVSGSIAYQIAEHQQILGYAGELFGPNIVFEEE